MRSSARQRRDAILAELYASKEVTASSLAGALSVSEATVRRDLRALAEEGQIVLNYGGATLPNHVDFSYRSKAGRNVDAKRIVGELAGGLIHEGDQIFVDSGTTCAQMVSHLKRKRSLSVIVNSARLALELDSPNLQVILLGGEYRPERMDNVGPLANTTLSELHGYHAFVSADGLNRQVGLMASDVESAYIFRLAVANAKETTLLADHTKFHASALCRIVGWESIRRVVTDRQPDEEWTAFFEEQNIEVIYPGTTQNTEE
ncbi:MAG: DeoR/GlpR transcriptional regulator [Phycisphaerae bacterium]|nr:DeoR/GlpR transcriptional regulator [Phycisphaerae bacterium]